MSTLENLKYCLQKDFVDDESLKFEDIEKQIMKKIKDKKSLSGVKLETIAKIEEYKNRQLISGFALLVSLVGIELSLLLNGFERGTTEFAINFGVATLCVLVLVIHIIIAVNQHVKNYKYISYYTIKLRCIEKIEKENSKQINNLQKRIIYIYRKCPLKKQVKK